MCRQNLLGGRLGEPDLLSALQWEEFFERMEKIGYSSFIQQSAAGSQNARHEILRGGVSLISPLGVFWQTRRHEQQPR